MSYWQSAQSSEVQSYQWFFWLAVIGIRRAGTWCSGPKSLPFRGRIELRAQQTTSNEVCITARVYRWEKSWHTPHLSCQRCVWMDSGSFYHIQGFLNITISLSDWKTYIKCSVIHTVSRYPLRMLPACLWFPVQPNQNERCAASVLFSQAIRVSAFIAEFVCVEMRT